jgi:Patatin-like phospholipase
VRRRSLLTATGSILLRLPFGFLLPFGVLAVGWTFDLFKEVKKLVQNFPSSPLDGIPILSGLDDIVVALFIVALYVAGLLLAYNLAVLTNWLLVWYGPKPAPISAVLPHRPLPDPPKHECFRDVSKIGIVLAGGGAKGAFQAGAMKAIYQFLGEGDALTKVKVIPATSIGSWNALFWLADLIQSEKAWEERSAHEAWWRSISLRSLVAPSWYVPGFRNAFFVTAPWQRQFDGIFGQAAVMQKITHSDIHFYLTCSHVRSGRLEYTTNNTKVRDLPRVKFTRLDSAKGDDAVLQGVKLGVFASMDLPPLFPYMEMGDDLFEDGGVASVIDHDGNF